MIKGKTQTGFSYAVDPKAIKDMEFIELAAKTRNDGLYLPELLNKALGEEQKAKLYKHVRTEDGNIPVDKVSEELDEILAKVDKEIETKN